MTLALIAVIAQLAAGAQPAARQVTPVLAFPEAGLDDPAAYRGYQTRFFRDASGHVTGFADRREGNDIVWRRT